MAQGPRAEVSSTLPSTATLTPTGASTASLGPSPQASQAVGSELAMADLAGATLTGRQHRELTAAQRALLAAVRSGHLEHAAALTNPEPTTRPTPLPERSPEPGTVAPKKALATLIKQERAAAALYAATAHSSTGFAALLWGSMSVAATTYGSALASDKAVPVASPQRRELPALSEEDAASELVAQIHALIYGYQVAIGRLPVLSKARTRAVSELLRSRILRDRLIGILTARSAKAPVPQAAYVPAVRVHDAPSAGLLIRRMQSALLPHCGLFLAAAGHATVRTLAFDTLTNTAAIARSWGAPATPWPGWA